MKTFGERTVGGTMMDDSRALINFKVMSVTRPILSVSKLVKMGYQVMFTTTRPCVVKGQRLLLL